jgi:hypothetical protein
LKHSAQFIAGACTAALLAACATQSTPDRQSAPAPRAAVNLSGFPPEFRHGYADGCASAKPGTARIRNEDRYKSDAGYAQGWRDGYDICGRTK